jgi:hypothetical protein
MSTFLRYIFEFASIYISFGHIASLLFRLGIDEKLLGSFRSNIGSGSPMARHILTTDLIIID